MHTSSMIASRRLSNGGQAFEEEELNDANRIQRNSSQRTLLPSRTVNFGPVVSERRHSAVPLLEPRLGPPKEVLNDAGAVDVAVCAHVMTVSGIDSKEQRFEGLVWIQMEWFIRLSSDDPVCSSWKPELTVLNLHSGSSKPNSFRVVPVRPGLSKCIVAYNLHGIFLHTFDLHAFPFDVQVLQVRCVCWKSPLERVDASTGECTPFRGRLAFSSGRHQLYEEGFVQKDIWFLDNVQPVSVRSGHTNENQRSAGDGQRFGTLTVEIVIKRRSQFYLVNVFLIFDLFVCLSFITFGVDIPQAMVSDRCGVVLNQVLTAAAFKVVIANMTPAVGYLTLADVFILLCFLFMGACACCAVFVGMQSKVDANYAREMNRIMGTTLATVWAAMHAVVPLVMYLCTRAYHSQRERADAEDAANRNRWLKESLAVTSSSKKRGSQLMARIGSRVSSREKLTDDEPQWPAGQAVDVSSASPPRLRTSQEGLHSRSARAPSASDVQNTGE